MLLFLVWSALFGFFASIEMGPSLFISFIHPAFVLQQKQQLLQQQLQERRFLQMQRHLIAAWNLFAGCCGVHTPEVKASCVYPKQQQRMQQKQQLQPREKALMFVQHFVLYTLLLLLLLLHQQTPGILV